MTTSTPRPLPVKPENIPESLKNYPNFVCWGYEWRKGKWTKVPKNPRTGGNAMADNPGTWGPFDMTLDYYRAHSNNGIAGIGFQLGDKLTPCVAWDFDHCRDPETGNIDPEVMKKVHKLNSYTEVSPSGKGLRVFAIGVLPESGRKKGNVECYDSGKYLTLTGHHLEETPTTIEARYDEIEDIHGEVFGNQERNKESTGQRAAQPVDLEDEELLKKARAAKNGASFSKLFDDGDISTCENDHSVADMALCCDLAFWFGNDPVRMDRAFRQSALMRSKFDEPHYSDGTTYGQMTIRRAIEQNKETYRPSGSNGGQPSLKNSPSVDGDTGTPPSSSEKAAGSEGPCRRHSEGPRGPRRKSGREHRGKNSNPSDRHSGDHPCRLCQREPMAHRGTPARRSDFQGDLR